MNQLSERYLEDLAVGQTFGSGRLRIEGERALAFAAKFDPQPFHLDEAAARRIKSRKAILDRVATDRVLVMGYHFPFPAIGHVVRYDTAYRWEPIQWAW